jgi:hypothetical protein
LPLQSKAQALSTSAPLPLRSSAFNDAESEAAETQVWIAFALECGYLQSPVARELTQAYDFVIGKLVLMIANPKPFLLPRK